MRDKFSVIVAGGRGFDDYTLLETKCNNLLTEKAKSCSIEIVSGGAKGADELGEVYATYNKYRGFTVKRFPADWEKYGRSAGYIRNREMGGYASAAIVFWDGVSRGSANMIETMKKLNKPVRIVRY